MFHCFRLLLGRHPHPEEWVGHASRAGLPLADVVRGYLGSLEFTRRRLLTEDRLGTLMLTEAEGFRIYAAPTDEAVGRHVLGGAYETDVTAVFRERLGPGMGVVDLGANIGWFTMLAASLVGADGYVLAVEPNPGNARMLEASRRANGFEQVVVSQTAAGARPGLLALNTTDSNGTTAATPEDLDSLLAAWTVPCVPVDALLPPGRRIDLIKVDVEGAEYLALQGALGLMERQRPAIVSEFSPDLMPGISGIDGPGYLRWLMARGYALAVIAPDGSASPADVAGVMAEHGRRGTDHLDLLATPA